MAREDATLGNRAASTRRARGGALPWRVGVPAARLAEPTPWRGNHVDDHHGRLDARTGPGVVRARGRLPHRGHRVRPEAERQPGPGARLERGPVQRRRSVHHEPRAGRPRARLPRDAGRRRGPRARRALQLRLRERGDRRARAHRRAPHARAGRGRDRCEARRAARALDRRHRQVPRHGKARERHHRVALALGAARRGRCGARVRGHDRARSWRSRRWYSRAAARRSPGSRRARA